MVHRFTWAACLVIAAAAVWLALTELPTFVSGAIVAFAQLGAYGALAALAWMCREHAKASWVILGTAGLTAPLTIALLSIWSGNGYGTGVLVILLLLGQAVVVVAGGYAGYALIESRRLEHSNAGHARGKLVVAAMLAAGAAALAGLGLGL